ncbi:MULTISPECIES: c-type cytochrome [Nitrosomonas]|uniref:Cytochrome C n=1 Tax=Nitrosomonas communis TaxID=44574 RepID=A0A0F7KJR9_9PROT|nr:MULTISPECIES: cytochrome c [Nitrosomonas]AKH39219.1 cytochrome C [Nitrosomonas communis]TYP88682.1 cytochrome c553 [Nitrosomonas communis]UVS61419.1 cytochrome c [Nitrosomonas sp. PLL12]SDW52799.1 Cytochrome c553 [Nitrosomonas communis]
MNNFVVAAVSGVVLLFSGYGIAADIEAGKKKAAEVCASCHGADGNSPAPNFPKIGGQPRTYLEKALKDYKTGERKDPIMAGMAAPLSEEDIENLAFYYSSQSGLYVK